MSFKDIVFRSMDTCYDVKKSRKSCEEVRRIGDVQNLCRECRFSYLFYSLVVML